MKFENKDGVITCEGNKGIFEQYESMKDITDSMLIDSETEIASYKTNRARVTLEVRGEVRVDYKDELYTEPSDFPKELIDLITNDKDWECHDDVYVGNNNWFEMFLWDNDGEYVFSDVVDAESLSTEELYTLLRDFYNEYEKKSVA